MLAGSSSFRYANPRPSGVHTGATIENGCSRGFVQSGRSQTIGSRRSFVTVLNTRRRPSGETLGGEDTPDREKISRATPPATDTDHNVWSPDCPSTPA